MNTVVCKATEAPPSVLARTSRPLKILHLAGTNRGATWMMEQLRELQIRGNDVCAYVSGEGPLTDKLCDENIDYEVVNLDSFWTLKESFLFLHSIYPLAWKIWKERYDVVHAHLFPTMLISRFAAWIADAPVRISMIPGPFYMEAEIPSLIEKSTAWMDTRIIASCQFTRDLYTQIGINPANLELVYYGADERNFDPATINRTSERQKLFSELNLADDTKLIGVVAYFYQKQCAQSRFIPRYLWNQSIKNHETVVEAAVSVVAADDKAHFVFVGDGWGEEGEKYRQSIIELVQQKGLSDHVSFLGHRDDIPGLISTFDVSLQCSLNENLGGTIESLLMARPMIGSRVGGIVDSIRHEETGLIVDALDHRGLAAAIIRLLRDPALASRLGNNGRKLMLEEFSLSSTVEDLEDVYSRCLNERKTAAYRWYLVPFRAIACLWWIGSTIILICDDEIKALLKSSLEQPTLPRFFQVQPKWTIPKARFLFLGLRIIFGSLIAFAAKMRRLAYVSAKRLIDIAISLLVLATIAPLLVLLYFGQSKRPEESFSRYNLLGTSNKPFTLRALNIGNQDISTWNLADRILSKLRYLPLFLNILKGEMSLVGPRMRNEANFDGTDVENYSDRWHMAPGLTGWSQLNRTNDSSEKELNAYDFLYLAHSGSVLDTKILLKTCYLFLLR